MPDVINLWVARNPDGRIRCFRRGKPFLNTQKNVFTSDIGHEGNLPGFILRDLIKTRMGLPARGEIYKAEITIEGEP